MGVKCLAQGKNGSLRSFSITRASPSTSQTSSPLCQAAPVGYVTVLL